MREQEFKDWLVNLKSIKDPTKPRYKYRTPPTYVSGAKRVKIAKDVDLDKEFRKDKMAGIIQCYTYAKDDTDAKVRARINMTITPKDPKTKLSKLVSDYRIALEHYRNFCVTNPPK